MSTRYTKFKRRAAGVTDDEWYTPPEFVRKLGAFDLDPCAGPLTRHGKINWTKAADGFSKTWRGRVWLNPPFKERQRWIEKLAGHGTGTCLINATGLESAWLQAAIILSAGVFLLHRRVEFSRLDQPDSTPPSGQCLILFGAGDLKAVRLSGHRGILLLNE